VSYRRSVSIALVLTLSPAATTALRAQSQQQPAPTERHIEYGFEQRVRNENWNNIFDWNDGADDERGQIRWRTRLWMSAPLGSDIVFNAGLVQETNQIFQPHTPTHIDEGALETLNIEFKKLFVPGLSLKFGRQNIMKGEGFLFVEGNPYDGSRSIYDNAAVLGYTHRKSKIELIGISNPRIDHYLSQINSKFRQLIEWNETALGAYYTDNNLRNTSIEGYYFYKREFGDRRAPTNAQFQPDRYVYTAGGRAVQKLKRQFSVTGEFAGQWGRQRPGRDIRAWGGYGYLKRNFGPKGRNYASFGYWAMSGTDPAHPNTIGNFDPLFSRWPKWSELYIYSQFREVGVGYWTNIGMLQGEAVYVPWKPLAIRGTYYHMNSMHPFAGNAQIFGDGTTRGNHYQVRADLTVNRNWKGHVLYEQLNPGDFNRYRSMGMFFRMEIIYTYLGNVAF
jgi:hypothetical protein